jgi:hypothetical protein
MLRKEKERAGKRSSGQNRIGRAGRRRYEERRSGASVIPRMSWGWI